MAERPINYLDLWYKNPSGQETEASFKKSEKSISITVNRGKKVLKVAFQTQDNEPYHAEIKTINTKTKKEVPTMFADMIALLQTSLDKDPDNSFNVVLKEKVLAQIKMARRNLNRESESLNILEIRVEQYEGKDREISQGHP